MAQVIFDPILTLQKQNKNWNYPNYTKCLIYNLNTNAMFNIVFLLVFTS